MRMISRSVMALAAWAALAPAVWAAGDTTRAVVKAIEARDCVGAVRELNTALATGSSEAMLLGGAMFEQGLCLKPNPERAVRLYQKAVDAGASAGRAKLAALYASTAGGPDKGAALWWGMQAGLALPPACNVDASLRGNADAFAKTLGSWPAGTLDACVYVTGVLASLDAEFVVKSQTSGSDDIAVDFRPANATLDARTSVSSQALIDSAPRVTTTLNAAGPNMATQSATPDQVRAQQQQEERQALLKSVQTVGHDALTRFAKPASGVPDWHIELGIESARGR